MTKSKRPEQTRGRAPRERTPRRFWSDKRGGIAVIAALVIPALAILTCGAIDLAAVNADRSSMQDASDATALAMAKQLGIASNAGITARAQQYAMGQLGQISSQDQVTVTTTIAQDNSSVTVAIGGHRPSFFGNMLPPGGWVLHTQATASSLGRVPLCVLASGASAAGDIQVENTSQMSAAKCLVQSNGDLTAAAGASVAAALAQATGTASGPITPTPQTGAPAISDPFASMTMPAPLLGICLPLNLTAGLNILVPGTYCGPINVGANQTLNLLPGEYYFKSATLNMSSNSGLKGSNVVLVFDDHSSFNFQDTSSITLSGAQSGPYAGFVIVTTRANTNTFTISSTNARQLEGAIYVPDATLQVTGTSDTVNDQAAWTVIVAQALQLTGSPNLVINANYASSSVPVPAGVGSNYSTGQVTLTK